MLTHLGRRVSLIEIERAGRGAATGGWNQERGPARVAARPADSRRRVIEIDVQSRAEPGPELAAAGSASAHLAGPRDCLASRRLMATGRPADAHQACGECGAEARACELTRLRRNLRHTQCDATFAAAAVAAVAAKTAENGRFGA